MMLTKRGVKWMLRSRIVNRAVRTLACLRGRGLVLVYHRIGVFTPRDCEIVPTVPVDLFRMHMQALGEVADLVTIDELLSPVNGDRTDLRSQRPSVAVTFDDDLPSHVAYALPVLREMLVPAAFFLSGRAMHCLGPYWFQQLEALLITHGAVRTAALLGTPPAAAARLARACLQSPAMRRRLAAVSAHAAQPSILQREDIAALSAAGMTIGFHTLDHDVLPTLGDAAMEAAVVQGRNQLAAAARHAVRFFAYPYGRVDARSARVVRNGGFEAAFTGQPEAVHRRHDRYTIGRWEPGPLGVDELVVKLAMYLHRPVFPGWA